MEVRTVEVVQYIKPLREGGSLPAIVEGSDEFLYVLKFKGAGQGQKALIAELIGGLLAQVIGLKVPEIVLMPLDDTFSKVEPDQEIQDLLKFSVGLNLGLHFLSGAITYDPLSSDVDPLTASKLVLLDSIITNIDRTVKNTNLLIWKKELWLIDHGASLYFHHNWKNWDAEKFKDFPQIKDHVLLAKATQLEQAADHIQKAATISKIENIVHRIPAQWLIDPSVSFNTEQFRNAYKQFLNTRISRIDRLISEAKHAR